MKLSCSVAVADRAVSSNGINVKLRYLNSTLALCKNPKTKDYCILLFSLQNKTGKKYELKHISKVLTRFIQEGKVTIQFKEPQHDLYIQGDHILLKNFCSTLQNVVQNKVPDKELTLSSLSVTASKPIVKKMTIEKPSELPTKGFPRTLEVLRINNLNCCTFNRGILQLVKLQTLDLSNNCIEKIPTELCNLACLKELNLSSNRLGESGLNEWKWLSGKLSKTLQILDLRNNALKFISNNFMNLERLTTLHLDNNKLHWLPPTIGNLKLLRTLTLSNNVLDYLPCSARRFRLQHLDLSNNVWQAPTNNDTKVLPTFYPMFSLKELAIRSVSKLKLTYTPLTLPYTLIQELQCLKYCLCGCACSTAFVQRMESVFLEIISHTITFSSVLCSHVPIETYYCSMQCYNLFRKRRVRIAR